MTKKIESLTPEQEAQMEVYRDEWLKIGLSTEPLDFEKAKAAMLEAYRLADLPEPTHFYVADSPVHAIKVIQEIDPSMTKSDVFNSFIYGAHDASWLSFYAYWRDVCGLECCNRLNGLIELAKHCGWASVFEDVVVLQHRPEVIKLDDTNRLHCENGPAIRFRDGFSIYSWHGVRVPRKWIENKENLTAKIALTWENVEQRRAACEILGWVNVLRELKAVTIDEDDDPEIGTLVEVDIPEIGKEKFLKVLCGTGREFALPVPPDMETALQANAWTFGFDNDALNDFLKPEVRT